MTQIYKKFFSFPQSFFWMGVFIFQLMVITAQVHASQSSDDESTVTTSVIAHNFDAQSLDLSSKGLNDADMMDLVKRFTKLTALNLVDNFIMDQGAIFLSENTTLTHLNLAENSILDKGGIALAANIILKSLNLSDNALGDPTASTFSKNTTLTDLNLRDNAIEDGGAIDLSSTTTLTALNLENNLDITDSVKEVLRANTHLKDLKL